MGNATDYAGFFINLDHNTHRRAETETELARHNLTSRYQRFAAAEGNALNAPNPHNLSDGVLGCFTSHYLLLKQNLDAGKHLHVIEDEVLFASCAERVISWVIASGFLDSFDIVFTDISVPLRNEVYKMYKTAYDKAVARDASGKIISVNFDVLNVCNRPYASTSSFLVNKRSIGKLCGILESELMRGTGNPIDLIIRDKNRQGALRVGCIFPFVTSVRLDNSFASTIDPRPDREPELAVDIARQLFFIESDWSQCQAYLDRYAPKPQTEDKLSSMLGQLLTYSLSDKYRFF
ncbi:MAG: glycosyltransferase family 25 protein [Alphaproteobacteria bacterium]|nr:glycosyltransferase family 25 protein [Alphaproteobacteria bacterium]